VGAPVSNWTSPLSVLFDAADLHVVRK
jgi:hypothetical protein